MDILGALYSSRLPDLLAYDAMHLEWWTNDFQFSSLTTCLFWVFNQTVGAWLATVCFLQEKDCRNYLLLGTACLMCGPFPFVGLVIFMVVRGIVLLAQRQKGVLQSAFSPANVLVLVVVLSITASYFLANNAFGYSVLAETVAGNQAAQQTFGQNVLTSLQKGMLVFYLLDAGIYRCCSGGRTAAAGCFIPAPCRSSSFRSLRWDRGAISACGCPSRLSLS